MYVSPVLDDKDRISSLLNSIRGFEEFVLDLNGKILSSNLEIVNITGYEEWEVIGKSFSIFYTEDDRLKGQPYRDLFEVLKSGRVFRSGWRVKKKGVSFWAKVLMTALRNDAENVTGFRVAIKDVTQYVVYNYRTRKLRNEYLNLFNNPFVGVIKFMTTDFKILLSNAMTNQLLQLAPEKDNYFINVFQTAGSFNTFISALMTKGYVKDYEFQLHNSNVWLSINCTYLAEHAFAEGIIQDITEQKKQATELNRLNMEIEKFIYHSSHDLRAPLTTILGLSNLISLQTKESEVLKYNELIKAQVSHLDALLQVLVTISFNNAGDVNRRFIDLPLEINKIIQKCSEANPEVTVKIRIRGESLFYSDDMRVRIILENLISNAFKFKDSSKGSFVKVYADVSDGHCVIQVKDNGTGIEKGHFGKIFNLFFKTRKNGFGLGLYIVKSSVDLLKGKIEFESKPSTGTLFRITLPNMLHLQS
jgi:PAS domain S-box-containing protein